MSKPPNDLLLDPLLRGEVERLIKSGGDVSTYFLFMLENTPALVSAIDSGGKVIFASKHYLLLGGVAEDLAEMETEQDLYPRALQQRIIDMPLMDAELEEAASPMAREFSMKHKDGSGHVYNLRRYRMPGESGQEITLTLGLDVTDHKLAENALRDHKSQLNYVTFHDPLTGLANRSLFYDRLNKSLSRAKRNRTSLALMLVDLDRFKNINDSLGRDAGDRFLKQAAIYLREAVRDTDTVARISGDEFVVVLENIARAHDIESIATKLLESMSKPVAIHDHEISCTASIGISLFPKDGDTTDQLLRHADLAMYKAKAAGKNRHQFFVKAMTESAVNYLLLENDLRKAIDKHELTLFYQPQIDIAKGEIVGLEALVRWQHSHRGLVSPAHFIPLAEETGLIEPLGLWVLKHACERFNHWRKMGIDFGKIAVNISARQFRRDNFDETVMNVLSQTQLPPELLELELTETSAMENAADTIDMLKRLHGMGLSLAIDDFGTGYSSLAYLKRFPIHKLKVDRSFIKDIDTNKHDAAIAKSIIDLGHNMSLSVIAEGVERIEQANWLKEKGCDQIQGFYYAKPLSEEQLIAMLSDASKVIVDKSRVKIVNKP